MKTKEELNVLKQEVENVNKKLAELTDEELAEVSGGRVSAFIILKHDFETPVIDTTASPIIPR